MSEPDNTPLLPTPFATMHEGENDPREVMAVQRFLLRMGPTIAMKLMPKGADGKFDDRMRLAVEAYQNKFGVETPNKGALDAKTAINMGEMRQELATQDRPADTLAHIASQVGTLPMHPQEHGEGLQAKLRSSQLHDRDAASHMKAEKPNPQVTKYIQEMLQARGYNLGPEGVDGKPGKFTRGALEDYQRDAGLLPSGFLKNGGLDAATMELLKVDEEHVKHKKDPALKAGPATVAPVTVAPPAEDRHVTTVTADTPAPPKAETPSVTMPSAITDTSTPAKTNPTDGFTYGGGKKLSEYKAGEMLPGHGKVVDTPHVNLPSQNHGLGSINLAALFAPVVRVTPIIRPGVIIRFDNK